MRAECVKHHESDSGAWDVLLVLHPPVDRHQHCEACFPHLLERRTVLQPFPSLVRHGSDLVVWAGG
jgi:hypothetical protein